MPEKEIYLSLIVPCFNEADNIEPLSSEIRDVFSRIKGPCELIFVDDGSTDGTFERIVGVSEKSDDSIRAVRLRRRFGKSAALTAGFREARGRLVATCDADGQDDPAEIPCMIQEIDGGADFVSAWRKKRRDMPFKRITSWLYNTVARVFTGVKLHDINCGLKVFRREVIEDLELTGDLHRIIPLMAAWKGFKVAEVVVNHRKRLSGRSKYGLGKLPLGFLDLFMFIILTRYSRRPGHFLGCIGLPVFLGGFGISFYFLVKKLCGLNIGPNYPLFVLGVLLIVAGLQMIFTGFLAEMFNYNLSAKADYSIAEKFPEE